MTDCEGLSFEFGNAQKQNLSAFEKVLKGYFERYDEEDQSAAKILTIIEKLQLPIPQQEKDFLKGREGALLFLNPYGIVIRIESKTADATKTNDSPWVLKPLAIFQAGKAVIEICPGTHFELEYDNELIVMKALRNEGYQCTDVSRDNIGILPFYTPKFPDGVPVVVDRSAVLLNNTTLWNATQAVIHKGPQEILYGPLKAAFKDAWPEGDDAPDPDKIRLCWQMCRQFVNEGKLVAGWNDHDLDNNKARDAKNVALNYEQKYLQCSPHTPHNGIKSPEVKSKI